MTSSIRVVLVEDHVSLRAQLRATLAASPDIVVVGEAATGDEAIRLVRAVQPDVLVLDVGLAGAQDGVQVASHVTGGQCRVLAFSAHSDPVHVAHLLRAGASGYLSKEAPVGRIVEAIRAVAAGESRWFEADPFGPVSLQPDELSALRHLASGGRADTLAETLGVTPEAAVEVTSRLYTTLGASSWYEAVARGWGLGLVGAGRVEEPGDLRAYSIRVNVPGQASSARASSYGA